MWPWLRVALLMFIIEAVVAQMDAIVLTGSNTLPSSFSDFDGDILPADSGISYLSYSSTRSFNASATSNASVSVNAGFTATISNMSSSSPTVTLLQGSTGADGAFRTSNNSTNSTARSTSSSSEPPTNTQACNHHPEFCTRKYSNITQVAAHNSPFVNANNAAANQLLPVIDQLNDGVRMLQGQTHYNSSTGVISYCHSSCDLLNAGTAEAYFSNITRWVRRHPYDVVSLPFSCCYSCFVKPIVLQYAQCIGHHPYRQLRFH